ncbi:ion transporter [Limosilactobacillus frumenti]|nr:ion transporter [Limosilactobacillus frumenti]MBA2913414.1 ion transporter [Limosilactobacillus frumenti]QFG72705.1 ion transporter [Limosilactobacillus frumenti]
MSLSRQWQIIYLITMALLAVISAILILFDFANEINIMDYPFSLIDNVILIIFAADYFIRLFLAKNKKKFFIHNILDLLSIIPVSQISWLFRLGRISRTLRLLRLLRLVGLSGRLKRFLNSSSLVYYLYITSAVLLLSSGMYAISENVKFSTALWWAITTATTVGYGDISPEKPLGRIAAVLLMLVGIGLIGVLTSSITDYFSKDNNQNINDKLDHVEKQNQELQAQLTKLNQQLAELKNKSAK